MQAHVVRSRQQLRQGDKTDARMAVGYSEGIVGDDLEAERLRLAGDLRADGAEAHHSEHLAAQP